MKCRFEFIPDLQDHRGWRKLRCISCGQRTPWTPHGPDRIFTDYECPERPPGPDEGPGEELHTILDSLGLKPDKTCGCEQMIHRMNVWGADGCIAHLPEIVAHLRKAYASQSWLAIKQAQLAALTTGLAFELDWRDPIRSLVRLAVERAKKPLAKDAPAV